MNRDYTLNELGDKLVELGKKNHGHAAHAFAYGTITGMLNGPIMNGWSMEEIQKYINDKFEQVSKEFATA